MKGKRLGNGKEYDYNGNLVYGGEYLFGQKRE